MKKVLVICDLFPPAFGPRMGYLCKYLPSLGWEPTVLTEDVKDENSFNFLKDSCKVRYIKFYETKKDWHGKSRWLKTVLLDYLFDYKDQKIFRAACKILRKESFDLILCSSFRTFPLPAALKAAKKFNIPLVVDLRDIVEQYSGNEFIKSQVPSLGGVNKLLITLFRKKMLNDRNLVLHKADYVTTISPWHQKFLTSYNKRTELIYNGYDPAMFYPASVKTDKFIITYTGRIISTEMRDPSLLFKAIATLSEQKKITPENVRIQWYVDEASIQFVEILANQYLIADYMDYKNYIDADKIPTVLNESSILLLLTNKSNGKGPKGVMTTKFFESLAVEKPILCVRSDEESLETAIHEANAGLAAREVKDVCDFLTFYYNQWKNSGTTRVEVNKRILKKYDRTEQAKQFVNIFEQVIDKKD